MGDPTVPCSNAAVEVQLQERHDSHTPLVASYTVTKTSSSPAAEDPESLTVAPLASSPVDTNSGDWGFVRAYRTAQAWMASHPISLPVLDGSVDEECTSDDEHKSSLVAGETARTGCGNDPAADQCIGSSSRDKGKGRQEQVRMEEPRGD